MLRLFAKVFSSALIVVACATAQAQQPKLEMHRVGVNADDALPPLVSHDVLLVRQLRRSL
jgi:hypothetical protein